MLPQLLTLVTFASATLASTAISTVLSVTGTGSVNLNADVAHIVITISATQPTALEATQSTAVNATSVLAALHRLNATKINTDSIYLSASYNYENNKQTFVGYQSQVTISFETDPKASGRAIDAVVRNGASSIGSISFSANDDNTAKGQKQATANAVQDALNQAQTVAAQLKLCVQGATKIDLNPQQASASPMFEMKVAAAPSAGGDASTPVESSQISVSSSISAVFQLGVC
ncbi:hypothetical protein HDU99_000440 [Rhizoclosmatium hyalinum]|nr:hypothetical protein HDU99_000440 [Rhizoclosmatium hyalinum]